MRAVPKIEKHFDEIKEFINSIPEEYNGIEVCSKLRKDFYNLSLHIRQSDLLAPAYEHALKELEKDLNEPDYDDSNFEQGND